MPRRLIVEIVGDSRALERSYKRSTESTRKFGHEIGRAGRGAISASGAFRSMGRSVAFASSAFLGGAGLIAVVKSSIDHASNLVEQMNKVKVVFGDASPAVVEWSKTTAESIGIAEDKALEFAGTFGNILVPMGFARDAAAQFSTQLVQLAADMASFNNATPEDVLTALRSGIVGQARPLRIYGVLLSEARVKAEALADGFVTLTRSSSKVKLAQQALAIAEAESAKQREKHGQKSIEFARAQLGVGKAAERVAAAVGGSMPALTDYQKGLARLRIIYKDTGDAQGDFGRTLSTSLADQLRVFTALVADLQGQLGMVLLPIVLRVVKAFNRWLSTGSNRERLVKQLKGAVDGLAGGLRDAWAAIQPVIDAADRLAGALGGWKTAIELAIGAFAGFKVAGITTAVAVELANIAAARGTAAAWRTALITTGWGAFAIAAGIAAAYVMTHWDKVKMYFRRWSLEFQGTMLSAFLAVAKFAEKVKIWIPFKGTVHLFPGANDAVKSLSDNLDVLFGELRKVNAEIDEAGKPKPKAFKFKLPSGADIKGFLDRTIADAKAGQAAAAAAAGTKPPRPETTTWRERFQKTLDMFDLRSSRAQLTKSLQDDLAILKEQEAAIRGQLALHKGDLELSQKLVQTQRDRKDLEDQITANAKERRQARQFRALGLTATGDEPVPGVKGLRRSLGQFEKNVAGTFLDTKRTRSVLSRIRKVLAGGFGAIGRDVRAAIAKLLADLDAQLREHRVNQTRFRRANTRAMLAGLGLDPDEIRRVRARIATIGAGGTVPGGRSAAYAGAGGVVVHGDVHVHGVQDPRKFEHAVSKRARSRPVQRRGI